MSSTNCSLIDASSETSVIAKLRRLKIEENLLVKNINKISPRETSEEDALPVIYSSEFKNYVTKLKNSFLELKHMFGDIKAVTEENLNGIDIGNMKRDVIKLDDKIRYFKKHLQSELTSATCQEEELTKQINSIEEKESKCKLKRKTRIKPFNLIIPSPVKVMIQSPFKCQEVQQFQEFMKSSPNRYGGWTAYHHNALVQIWSKHFNSIEQIEFNNRGELIVGNHDQNEAFLKEVLQKIPGLTYDDIVSHHNWYCKYLYLKKQQQNALDKWKINKSRLTGSRYKPNKLGEHNSNFDGHKLLNSNTAKLHKNMENVEELFDIETRNTEEIANALCDMDMRIQEDRLSFDTEINITTEDNRVSGHAINQKHRSFSDLIKPTEQWTNRCKRSYKGVKCYNSLETIKKLRVPEWRLTLQD